MMAPRFSTTQAVSGHAIVQLDSLPTEEERQELAARGILLLEYVPENAWIAKVAAGAWHPRIRAVFPLLPSDKSSDVSGRVIVRMFADVTPEEGAQTLRQFEPKTYLPATNAWVVQLDRSQVQQVAAKDSVQRIEPVRPLTTELNNLRTAASIDALHTAAYDLNGSGVTVAIWAGGWVQANHTDLNSRLVIGDLGCGEASCGTAQHATHVAGIVGGNGSISQGVLRGIAWNATIASYEWPDQGESEALDEANQSIAVYNAVISQNSWGYAVTSSNCADTLGTYDSFTQVYDNITRGMHATGNRTMLVVFAAGNQRSSATCSSSAVLANTTTGPGATAKNVITVGSVNSNDNSMTSYSSWGPTDDGRIKPDVVAPGDRSGTPRVNSTCPTNTYCSLGGTSMAAPAVSGLAALIYQNYRTLHNDQNPLPSTVKALIIQTAKDQNNTGPDFTTGYGLINGTAAIDLLRRDQQGNRTMVEGSVANGANVTLNMSVPSGASDLKVTLVWDDYPASVYAARTLVNNLDLIIKNASGIQFYPWTLNPAVPFANAVQTAADSTNNMEQVVVSGPTSGIWTITVNATSVPQGPQTFSLISNFSIGWSNLSQFIVNATNNDNTTSRDIQVWANGTSGSAAHRFWYRIYRNNTLNQTLRFKTASNNTLTLLDAILSGNLSISDVWLAEVWLDNGISNSSATNSSVTVTGSAPEMAQVVVNATQADNTSIRDGEVWARGTDRDTATFLLWFRLYRNNTLNQSLRFVSASNNTLTRLFVLRAGNISRSDVWLAEVFVDDAISNSSALNSSVTILNAELRADRKSTRLNSSHRCTSYAVFCLNN